MANININRDVSDQFYRYKMPRLIAKVEGKGNGIKTVIVNMAEIAKALDRPPTYPTKFFGCELGAQTQFDLKNERYIVNGSHEASKLQDLLDGFIKKFVLCPECTNPETSLNCQQRKGIILQRCIACGYQGTIDMRHKLTTFILKNPPLSQDSEKKEEKAKATTRKKIKENGDASPEPKESSDDIPPKIKSKKNAGDDDDDDWLVDTSEDAIQKRMMESGLTDAVKTMMLSDDLEKSLADRVNIFYDFVKDKKANAMDGGKFSAATVKEIVAEADRLEVREKAPVVLVELLFDSAILTQIKNHRVLFLQFTNGNIKAQKYLLGGVEQLVGNVHKEALMSKVAHILKSFYDTDILDEEAILDWDKKPSKKHVDRDVSKEIHTQAAPIIKWLQEADEESSEEEEDDDTEIVYSRTEKVGIHTIPKAGGAAVPKKDEPEDDLDIDDI